MRIERGVWIVRFVVLAAIAAAGWNKAARAQDKKSAAVD